MTSSDLYFKEITFPDLHLRGQQEKSAVEKIPGTSQEGGFQPERRNSSITRLERKGPQAT